MNLKKIFHTNYTQVQQLFSTSLLSITTSGTLAIILAYTLQEAIPLSIIYTWLGIIFIGITIRTTTVFLYRKNSNPKSESNEYKWLTRFRISILITSIAWGTAGVLLFPHQLINQMFLILIISGLTTGAIIAISADLLSSITFILLVVSPLTLNLFLEQNKTSTTLGFITTLFLLFMILNLIYFNKKTTENTNLQLKAIENE